MMWGMMPLQFRQSTSMNRLWLSEPPQDSAVSCWANSFKPTYRRLKTQPSHAFIKCNCTNNLLNYSKHVRCKLEGVATIREKEQKLRVENSTGLNLLSSLERVDLL